MHLDALKDEVGANVDDIAILDEILGISCVYNSAIGTILSDGT